MHNHGGTIYEKNEPGLNHVIILQNICRPHDLSFEIIYSNGSNSYDVEVYGIAQGEDFYAKNYRYLSDAIYYIEKQMVSFYERLKSEEKE